MHHPPIFSMNPHRLPVFPKLSSTQPWTSTGKVKLCVNGKVRHPSILTSVKLLILVFLIFFVLFVLFSFFPFQVSLFILICSFPPFVSGLHLAIGFGPLFLFYRFLFRWVCCCAVCGVLSGGCFSFLWRCCPCAGIRASSPSPFPLSFRLKHVEIYLYLG